MKLSAIERLKQFYSQFQGDDHVLVLINADPDAIASAMAVKRLLWRKVVSVVIARINTVKRPDNLTMMRLCKADVVPFCSVKKETFSKFVLVDSQPCHSPAFNKIEFDVVIDHHPVTEFTANYIDIRVSYGATATIFIEYLRTAGIKPSVRLASALFYAIKVDTGNFERKTVIEDVRAFQFLYKYANIHIINRIEQAEIHPSFLKYFKIALEKRRLKRGRMFIHLGNVSNPDVCVLIADFFIKVSLVKWSIVSGISNKKLIIIFRNDGLNKNAGSLAQKSFGKLGSAGGHRSMARAEILISAICDQVNCKQERKLCDWIIDKIEKRS